VAQNDAQWRGRNRDGVYQEKNLLKKWADDGPKLLWHFDETGKGFSSVVVAADRIFTTGMFDDKGFVLALDLTGKFLWKTEYGKEWTESWPGSRTTPTFLDDKLYLASSFGLATCVDAKKGKILWQIDLQKEYGATPPKWGITESPLIIGEKVIFTTGSPEANMVALNRNDGKKIWASKGKGELTAYCSPVLIDHKGKKIIVTHTANSILGINPESGDVIWTSPKTNKWSVHANTPVYSDGQIYCVSGYGSGGVMLKLSDDGTQVTELWKNTSLDNQMGGVILYNGNIYGSGQDNKSWQCLDWKTGAVKYTSTAIGKGAVIFNDGLLYCYSDKGELALMKPTETAFELISKFNISLGSDWHWAHPVINNGILYMRHGNVLMAYSIKE